MTSDELYTQSRRSTPRLILVFQGGVLGLVVSLCATAILGPMPWDRPSLLEVFSIWGISLTVTGMAVGALRWQPMITGSCVAPFVSVGMCVIVLPHTPWMLVSMLVFGLSGAMCGLAIGALFYWLRKEDYEGAAGKDKHAGGLGS